MFEVDEKVLTDVKTWLVNNSSKWFAGVTRGEAFDLQGKSIGGKNYNICHAWVPTVYSLLCFQRNNEYLTEAWDTSYAKDAKNFLLATCHSKVRSSGICSAEAHEALILWLASDESPFSQWILNKDDKDSLRNGGLIILCGPDGATCSQAMWLCKVLRYGIEAGAALDVWKKLVDGGVDPMFAIYTASVVRTVRGATFGYTGIETHSTVFRGYVEFDVSSLLRREFNPKANDTTSLFSPKESGVKLLVKFKTFSDFCKPTKVSDGWGGQVDSYQTTSSDFTQKVLELQNKLLSQLNVTTKLPDSSTVYLDLDM